MRDSGGAGLVSPNDVLSACELFAALDLPFRLRTFPSGVKVVQNQSLGDEETAARLVRKPLPMFRHVAPQRLRV